LEDGAVLKDTDPKVDAIYEKMLLSRAGVERMRMASSMYTTAKALILVSLREKYPHASDAEFRGILFLRIYAEDFSAEQRTKIYRHLVGESD
jgi:hypothetical protein